MYDQIYLQVKVLNMEFILDFDIFTTSLNKTYFQTNIFRKFIMQTI